jgi:protein transport protein SEC31
LRSSTTSPLCELVGHTKGILSVDWCPWDQRLVMSAGKDGHTLVWDITQGRAIAEVRVRPSGVPHFSACLIAQRLCR